jgi:CubicO group peptidase (beta-lactamase class C family)
LCVAGSLGAVLLVICFGTAADLAEPAEALDALDREMLGLVEEGEIVGGQWAVCRDGEMLVSLGYGVVAEGSERPVDEETLFLIASCSKPFASMCLLSLVDDDEVEIGLSDEIDQWLPRFGEAKVKGGGAAERAPTVEELMAHRSGLYSQKVGMTKAQARWIRDFRVGLEESVEGIASYELIAQPGEDYAYSGAGYCVLGRVAEVATGDSFESILQERLCGPLGLSRTTYFPAGKFSDDDIATGANGEAAPHLLGERHRLPLIGGSLYTTAEEMAYFGQGVLAEWYGEEGEKRFKLKPGLIKELGIVRSPESGYGLGWKVLERDGKAVRLSHSGALQSYRAWMAVDLEKGVSIAACWTLGKDAKAKSIILRLQEALEAL